MQQHLQLEQMIQPVLHLLPESLQKSWITDASSSCQQLSQQLQQRQKQSQEFKTLETHMQSLNQQIEKARDLLSLHQQYDAQLQQKMNTALNMGKALREQLNHLTLTHAGQIYPKAQEWRDHLEQQQQALDEQLRAQSLMTQQHDQHLQQAELKNRVSSPRFSNWNSRLGNASNLFRTGKIHILRLMPSISSIAWVLTCNSISKFASNYRHSIRRLKMPKRLGTFWKNNISII